MFPFTAAGHITGKHSCKTGKNIDNPSGNNFGNISGNDSGNRGKDTQRLQPDPNAENKRVHPTLQFAATSTASKIGNPGKNSGNKIGNDSGNISGKATATTPRPAQLPPPPGDATMPASQHRRNRN